MYFRFLCAKGATENPNNFSQLFQQKKTLFVIPFSAAIFRDKTEHCSVGKGSIFIVIRLLSPDVNKK